jgi:hypothetical protein
MTISFVPDIPESNILDDDVRVRQYRGNDFMKYGMSRATALRMVREMEGDGVLTRRGRFWWGRGRDVDAWLTGTFVTTVTRGKRGSR